MAETTHFGERTVPLDEKQALVDKVFHDVADRYDLMNDLMIKAGGAGDDAKPFCKEEGSELTENADGSATCVMTSEGAFADLKYDDSDNSSKPTFTTNPDGTVRVAVATKGMNITHVDVVVRVRKGA